MYADDVALYYGGNDINQLILKMNDDLRSFNEWCVFNGLDISIEKSNYMIFHKAHDTKFTIKEKVYIQSNELVRVYTFKYLGVILNPSLFFNEHFDMVSLKLNSAIAKIQCIKRFVNDKVLRTLINAYVVSVVDFCICIWSVQNNIVLDALFLRVLHLIASVN